MLFIIDFDGTISQRDTVDAMLEKFADASWMRIEEEWLAGNINAVECMSQQVRMVKADHVTLEGFFRAIELDPGFIPLYRYLHTFAGVAVVSDGLDHAVKLAIRKTGLPNIPIYANRLHFVPDGLDISFPNRVANCAGGNGTCKCAIAQNLTLEHNGPVVLIGDGKSDACLAGRADVVFAKGSLIRHCEKNGIAHQPFETLADVLEIIKTWPEAQPQPQKTAERSA